VVLVISLSYHRQTVISVFTTIAAATTMLLMQRGAGTTQCRAHAQCAKASMPAHAAIADYGLAQCPRRMTKYGHRRSDKVDRRTLRRCLRVSTARGADTCNALHTARRPCQYRSRCGMRSLPNFPAWECRVGLLRWHTQVVFMHLGTCWYRSRCEHECMNFVGLACEPAADPTARMNWGPPSLRRCSSGGGCVQTPRTACLQIVRCLYALGHVGSAGCMYAVCVIPQPFRVRVVARAAALGKARALAMYLHLLSCLHGIFPHPRLASTRRPHTRTYAYSH
jgi:hypothetical protein